MLFRSVSQSRYTASGSGSKLLDLQVGGVSKVSISKDHTINVATWGFSFDQFQGSMGSPDALVLIKNGAGEFVFDGNGAYAANGGFIGVSIDGVNSAPSVRLYAQAANILAQRNGTNPQEFRLYNTYDGTNDEWGFLKWDSNVLKIGTAASGTGTVRPISIIADELRLGSGTSEAKLETG